MGFSLNSTFSSYQFIQISVITIQIIKCKLYEDIFTFLETFQLYLTNGSDNFLEQKL